MPARKMLVVVALVAIGAAACGSSSKSASSSTATTTTQAPGSASATTTPGSTATPTTGKVSGDSDSNFCELARKDEDAFKAPDFTQSPTDLKTLYSNLATSLQHAEAIAPSAIKGDFATFAAFYKNLNATFAAANYNFQNISPTAFSGLDTAAVRAASTNVEQYMTQVCHIAAATPTT